MRTKMAFENAGYWIKDYKMYRKQENGENFVVLAQNKRSGMWATGGPDREPRFFYVRLKRTNATK